MQEQIARELGFSKSQLQDMMVECFKSTKTCASLLFPERFFAPFSSLHDQIFDLIDSGAPRIAIAAPRGIGKTSIVGLALAGKNILFRNKHFIPYVSKSFENSMMQTENLKRELVTNKLVKAMFGPLKTKDPDGVDEMFSKKSWVSSGNTFVLPLGSGQQIRGVLHVNYRPDLIIVDDLEDPDTIENDEQRTKRKIWFNADLIKAVSRVSKDWQIVYIDTLKHEDALLQDLLDSKDWESLRLEICDDDLVPTAPEFFTAEDIKREYEYHKEQGILDVFYREYRNLPISTEDATFRQEYFKRYAEPDLVMDRTVELENVLIVDPAKTVKLHSAESAVVCVGIDRKGARLYVRDVVASKLYPDELYAAMFEMAAKFSTRVVGVEVTSLNEFIVQPIKNEMASRGQFFELIELKARGKKEDRVASLVPYYRRGYIYHNEACCQGLESQLMAFPRPKRWDIMDALAYIVEMLELGDRYFDPQGEQAEEDEYKDLTYDDPVDDWRTDDGWDFGGEVRVHKHKQRIKDRYGITLN